MNTKTDQVSKAVDNIFALYDFNKNNKIEPS